MKLQKAKSGQFFMNLPRTKIFLVGWKQGTTIDINLSTDGRSLILTKVMEEE